MADKSHVKEFLKNHPHLEIIVVSSEGRKVKCKLTGHELPCRLADLETYTRGKKYQRLCQGLGVQDNEPNVTVVREEYRKFLVPAGNRRNQLYCKLTKKYINNLPHHINKHFNGRLFKRALTTYDASEEMDHEPQSELNNIPNATHDGDVWVPSDGETDDEPENEPDLVGCHKENVNKEEDSSKENAEEMEEDDDEGLILEEDEEESAEEHNNKHRRKGIKRTLKEEIHDIKPKKSKKTRSSQNPPNGKQKPMNSSKNKKETLPKKKKSRKTRC